MKKLWSSTQNLNRMIILLMGAAFWIWTVCSFDLYYDLNDDVVIQNILSGAYTGTPEGHNMQTLYLLGALIALFYRLIPKVPWFGVFLSGCLLFSFYIIGTRLLDVLFSKEDKKTQFHAKEPQKRKIISRILAAGIYFLAVYGLFFYELIYIQYTVVSSVLVMAAAVLFLSKPCQAGAKELIQNNRLTIILLFFAFMLRSEMMLLTTPFLAMAGVYVWSREKRILCRETVIKYGVFLLFIILGMGLFIGVDEAAYADANWKESRDFFRARTQVYDFTWYPAYEDAKEFYESIGISPAQFNVIDNYNFGLDSGINADTLYRIADYQIESARKSGLGTWQKAKKAVFEYFYRTFHFQTSFDFHEGNDMPYNLLTVFLYGILFLWAIFYKDGKSLLKMIFFVLLRSIPWLYLFYKGRIVARITHPLYLLEIVLLVFFVIKEREIRSDAKEQCVGMGIHMKRAFLAVSYVLSVFLLLVCIVSLFYQTIRTGREQERRSMVNEPMERMSSYAGEHADCFYYLDVYSTVDFSEKIFSKRENRIQNFDILGGWTSKTKLSHKKEEKFQIADIESDFLTNATLFFAVQKQYDVAWLVQYYQEKGIAVIIEEQACLGEAETDFVIYRLQQQSDLKTF